MNKCAFDLEKKCAALTDKECKGCRFRKSKEELEEGREKARRRLDSLPIVQREYIKHKYHIR